MMQAIKGYIHRTIDYASNLPSLFIDETEPTLALLIKLVLSVRDSSNDERDLILWDVDIKHHAKRRSKLA